MSDIRSSRTEPTSCDSKSRRTAARTQNTLIRCNILASHTQLKGDNSTNAARFSGGMYEKIGSDLTPSTVLTTR